MKHLGFLLISLLTAAGDVRTQPLSLRATITDNNVLLRKDPGRSGSVLGKLSKGTLVSVLSRASMFERIYECDHDWFQVSGTQGTGWVYGQFLSTPQDSSRKRIRSPSGLGNYAVSLPGSWQVDNSVVSTYFYSKVMEFHAVSEFHGNLLQHYLDELKNQPVIIARQAVIDTKTIRQSPYPIYRIRTSVAAEGGCPHWVIVWYPIVYLVQLSPSTYASFSVYLQTLDNTDDLSQADQIASSVQIQ